jgi:hypothetical protein
MKKGFLIICLSLLIGQAFSYSVLERFEGTYISNLDPRSAAMGGATVAESSSLFNADINPANLALLNSRFGSVFHFQFMRNEDKRSFPMYNFFDGLSGDATYAANEHYFNNFGMGIFGSYNINDFKLAAGLLYTPYISFDCLYDEQVRNDENSDSDNYPPIIAKNSIESDGVISQLGFILAIKHHEKFAWGMKIAKLTGEQDYEDGIFWTQSAISSAPATTFYDTTNVMKREFDAIQFSFGGNYQVNERLNIGLSLTPSTEFDVTGDWAMKAIDSEQDTIFAMTTGDIDTLFYSWEGDWQLNEDSLTVFVPKNKKSYADFKTPSRTRFGFSYKPQNIMRTFFNVDLEYVQWSDVNPLFHDELNYFIGIEHQVGNSVPFRIGFNYKTNYQISYREVEMDDVSYTVCFGDKITMPGFTAGTGFKVLDKFTVDISGEFTQRSYETLDLFPDGHYNIDGLYASIAPTDRGWENPDTVKENFTVLKIALGYNW